MEWIEITSPRLRDVHRGWCDLKAGRMLPHILQYNRFSLHFSSEVSVCVMIPVDKPDPVFKYVGGALGSVLPACPQGARFSELTPLPHRTAVTVPYHRVSRSRQPECRRGQFSASLSGGRHDYEHLLLPFSNDNMRVCVIHSLYDLMVG